MSAAALLSGEDGFTAILADQLGQSCIVTARKNPLSTVRLFQAAVQGNVAALKKLLGRGVSVQTRDENGGTALHMTAQGGQQAAVRFLMYKIADFNAKNKQGITPLNMGPAKGSVAVVRELLGAGTELEGADDDGEAALHWAARIIRERSLLS